MQVRRSALAAHDDATVGSADSNLASVNMQLNVTGLSTAEMYARESLAAYSRIGKPGERAQAQAMMTLADILSREQMTPEGEQFYQAGINAATRLQDWPSASKGWLHYGDRLLKSGRLEAADRAFAGSYSLLHRSGRLNGEDAVLCNLSRLRLLQHDLRSAQALIDSAIRVSPTSGGRITPRLLYQTRAEVELARGDATAALRDARRALQSARFLRANIVPDNDNRVGIEGVLDDTFSVLMEAGNLVYLKTGDGKVLRETFEAAEENRAESLSALLPAASDWRAKLSTSQYRYKLSQLFAAQRVAWRLNSAESAGRLARIETELSELEASAGATVRMHTGTTLDRVRHSLPRDSALLSFRLGDRASWLWTVYRDRLRLYRLPPKAILMAEIHEFQAAILDNDMRHIPIIGRQLYRDLMGGPGRSFAQSSQWYISLDEPLYTLAFPALVVETGKRGPVYLTQRKTLQVLPGAQLLGSPDRGSLVGMRFVLAGDGVYNRADPRYSGSGLVRPASWGMARLPGSGAEVRFAADLWRHAALLTGPKMTKEALLREIDRDPDVIHIASHVIEGQDRWHTSILALGIDPTGEPDLLTSREIQMHPLHARLVVMSGCSSGSGEALPASGLMGLTRAWLAAGAGEVLATRWPTMDESGDGLIGSFYLHLLASQDGNIPKALREARRDMIARGGWRAEPRYWSSFFLIGVR